MRNRKANARPVVDIIPAPRLSPNVEFSDVVSRVYQRFDMVSDHYDLRYTIGDEEMLLRRRREMERVAAIFEGLRARLMNGSHTIQQQIDKRRRVKRLTNG